MREQIALDFDSTLAATSEVAFDLLCGEDHDYDYDSIDSWNWGFKEFGKEAFLSAQWHSWTIRPLNIRPLEPGLPQTVDKLQSNFEVDIVTAHPDHLGITDGKKSWLKDRGIEYDNFVVVELDESKADLGYDIYIDDKPTLPAEVNEANPFASTYLIDHQYNQDAGGNYTRVGSVKDARALIEQAALLQ